MCAPGKTELKIVMYEWHSEGFGFMWIFWILVAGLVGFALGRSRKTSNDDARGGESPLEVLKSRYAHGELDREQYESMRKDIEN